jgi:predicted nuclease with TOPRIM domain
MSSELEVLKQRITELEAENTGLRIKLSVTDAEIAELKRRNAEVLRANGEYNEMRDAKVKKLEQKNAELEARLAVVEKSSMIEDRKIGEVKGPSPSKPNPIQN